jgi:hypothetical protein
LCQATSMTGKKPNRSKDQNLDWKPEKRRTLSLSLSRFCICTTSKHGHFTA